MTQEPTDEGAVVKGAEMPNELDKEALEKIAIVIGGADPVGAFRKAEGLLNQLKALGYCKLPKDRPLEPNV